MILIWYNYFLHIFNILKKCKYIYFLLVVTLNFDNKDMMIIWLKSRIRYIRWVKKVLIQFLLLRCG